VASALVEIEVTGRRRWPAMPVRREAKNMSQRTVGIVMDRLLADESFRLRFEDDPVETVSELFTHGVELTPSEIDLFVQSDAQMWFWIEQRVSDRLH
jgi:hypothetical protein